MGGFTYSRMSQCMSIVIHFKSRSTQPSPHSFAIICIFSPPFLLLSSVSNPTTVAATDSSNTVYKVTQNIPSGLTLAQANSALFLTNFAQVNIFSIIIYLNELLTV